MLLTLNIAMCNCTVKINYSSDEIPVGKQQVVSNGYAEIVAGVYV